MTSLFTWPIRVYWEDTDAGGVVYHGSYLRFLERARSEWMRERGINQSQLKLERGLVFVISSVQLSFRRPARLDDQLLATCVLEARAGASLHFTQSLIRASDQTLLVDAKVRAACVQATSFRPRAIPADLVLE